MCLECLVSYCDCCISNFVSFSGFLQVFSFEATLSLSPWATTEKKKEGWPGETSKRKTKAVRRFVFGCRWDWSDWLPSLLMVTCPNLPWQVWSSETLHQRTEKIREPTPSGDMQRLRWMAIITGWVEVAGISWVVGTAVHMANACRRQYHRQNVRHFCHVPQHVWRSFW